MTALNKMRPKRAVYGVGHVRARWTLIAPDGTPFVSLGMVHIADIGKTAMFQSRYGADWRRACATVAANLRDWGFNTVGYHHPVEMRELMPFMAEVYLAQVAYWMPHVRYVDVFSPSYPKAVSNLVRRMVSAVKAIPNLVGYYWTDTPRWDLELARRQVGDDWVSMIRRQSAPNVGKQRYVSFLRERHSASPSEFRAAYGVELGDVDTMLERDFSDLSLNHPIVHRDDYEFLRLIAREYYRVAGEAMEREDRRHLVFGDRYMLGDLPTEVLEEALPWIDVVAVQPFQVRFDREAFERVYRIARKPILICNHASNLPTESLSESDAARAYDDYLTEAFERPYIVGYHRGRYIDRSMTGTVKQGLLRENETPYATFVDSVRRTNNRVIEQLTR